VSQSVTSVTDRVTLVTLCDTTLLKLFEEETPKRA